MRKGSAIERLKASKGYHERLRQESREMWRDTAHRSAAYRMNSSPNTLPPPEDVLEARQRRHRQRVNTGSSSRSNPAESLFLLAFLVASIYGIYRLIVYVLAQG